VKFLKYTAKSEIFNAKSLQNLEFLLQNFTSSQQNYRKIKLFSLSWYANFGDFYSDKHVSLMNHTKAYSGHFLCIGHSIRILIYFTDIRNMSELAG
jgi:hypothetical protein